MKHISAFSRPPRNKTQTQDGLVFADHGAPLQDFVLDVFRSLPPICPINGPCQDLTPAFIEKKHEV